MNQAIKDQPAQSAEMLGKYMRYPFAEGNYSLALGLVPMAEETWLDIDENYVVEMREKARRLREEYDKVFCALPGSEPGQAEVLETLLDHLAAYYPNFFRITHGASVREGERIDPDTRIDNLINGETWRVGDFSAAPLDLAGRLIQEDLCLMSPDGQGTYLLSAGSVCFPLRWELTEKFGLPMAAIHRAVPGYDEKLAAPSDRYMLGLKEYKPSWRSNWSIVDAPDLYLKQRRFAQGHNTEITAENAGRKLWIRSERQTLRRLPRSGDVLFTIRTYIRPLSLLESLPSVARGLAQALDKVPPDMRGYKNQLPIRDALLAYLARISG
jgi:dimethylamine monooxygenase subunit A